MRLEQSMTVAHAEFGWFPSGHKEPLKVSGQKNGMNCVVVVVLMFIYLFLRESMSKEGAEREGDRILGRLLLAKSPTLGSNS